MAESYKQKMTEVEAYVTNKLPDNWVKQFEPDLKTLGDRVKMLYEDQEKSDALQKAADALKEIDVLKNSMQIYHGSCEKINIDCENELKCIESYVKFYVHVNWLVTRVVFR